MVAPLLSDVRARVSALFRQPYMHSTLAIVGITVSIGVGVVLYLSQAKTPRKNDEAGPASFPFEVIGTGSTLAHSDLSKQPPQVLAELLDSTDTDVRIGALRAFMAQSAFSSLQDATRSVRALEKLCTGASGGNATERLLVLEVLANYAPRGENRQTLLDGGILDVALGDLHRAAGRNTGVMDVCMATASGRLLLNLSATDAGALELTRVDLLRAMLEHAADNASPVRLVCLKILRNVAVSDLHPDVCSRFGGVVGRSSLSALSSSQLRTRAAQGDEAASLSLSVLDKARAARYLLTPDTHRGPSMSTGRGQGKTTPRALEMTPTTIDALPAQRFRSSDYYATIAAHVPSMSVVDVESHDLTGSVVGTQVGLGAVQPHGQGYGLGRIMSPTLSSAAKVRTPSYDFREEDGDWEGVTRASRGPMSTGDETLASARSVGGGSGRQGGTATPQTPRRDIISRLRKGSASGRARRA